MRKVPREEEEEEEEEENNGTVVVCSYQLLLSVSDLTLWLCVLDFGARKLKKSRINE